MGAVYGAFLGGYTPICNDCGVSLCWDISEQEYDEAKAFWDDWICQGCNNGVKMSRKLYYERKIKE